MAILGGASRFLSAVAVAGLLSAVCSVALAQQRVGVSGAVNPDTKATLSGGAARRVELGQEIVHREQINTDASGQMQIMFLDGSSMAIGPNSDLTIDEFVYDPGGGTGQLTMSATRGVLRFIGGELSKNEDAVTLRTPSATIGIRGGIFIVKIGANGAVDVIFAYGVALTVTGAGGITQTIRRPGFFVHVSERGAPPSLPAPVPDQSIGTALALLAGKGATGAASDASTDPNAAGSGAAAPSSSGNPLPAVETDPGIWSPTSASPAQSTLDNLNTIASQADPVIANSLQSPPDQGSPIPIDLARTFTTSRGSTISRSGSCALGAGCSSTSTITRANGRSWTVERSTIPNGIGGFDHSAIFIGPNGGVLTR